MLGVKPGDVITAEILEGVRPTQPLIVTATVDELIGLSAYMDLRAVNRLLREGGTLSGAFLSVDPVQARELYEALKRIPVGAGIGSRDAAWASFTSTLGESLGIVTTILVTLACLIAIALIYDVGRIALSERARELASLRVLGFTKGEIATMLLGEQALLTTVALPLGFGLGYLASALITQAYQWGALPAAVVSGLAILRRLNQLDLIAVLKTRD
ncbi:MAG: ABC transporter permease [Gemmatimonadota bacterium]